MVASVEYGDLSHEFVLDDRTGTIEASWWLPVDGGSSSHLAHQQQQQRAIQPNTYCMIIGHPRQFGSRVSINVVHIAAVADPNDLTHHLLDVVFAHAVSGRRRNQAAP